MFAHTKHRETRWAANQRILCQYIGLIQKFAKFGWLAVSFFHWLYKLGALFIIYRLFTVDPRRNAKKRGQNGAHAHPLNRSSKAFSSRNGVREQKRKQQPQPNWTEWEETFTQHTFNLREEGKNNNNNNTANKLNSSKDVYELPEWMAESIYKSYIRCT